MVPLISIMASANAYGQQEMPSREIITKGGSLDLSRSKWKYLYSRQIREPEQVFR